MLKTVWQALGRTAFWLGWPVWWLYLHGTKRSRVIIMAPDGKVLLVKGWIGNSEWTLPGGGLHRDEDPRAAALREVQEETSLTLEASKLRSLGSGPTSEYGISFTYHLFEIRLVNKPPVLHQKWELTAIGWFSPDELPRLNPVSKRLLAGWTESSSLIK